MLSPRAHTHRNATRMNENYQGTPTSESEDCAFKHEGRSFILVTFLLFHYGLNPS